VIDIAGQRRTLTPGQELTHGIRLNTIENDHVVLAFAGSTRILWGAVQGKPDDEGGSGPDIRERNRHIEVARLTASRPMMADTFLREVLVQANPRGGYEVVSVTPGSMYDKMGVLPGDVIYTLDTPKMAAVDEGSMIALMQQTEIELDVHRKGAQIRLRHALNVDEPAASATR
jgi:type II secretory pathway component PulC